MACDPAFADSIAPIGCELSDLGAPSAENCAGVASGADLGDALSIAKLVAAELTGMGLEMVEDRLRLQYVPDQEGCECCFEFGRRIAQAMKD